MWMVLILIFLGFLCLTFFIDSKSAIGLIGVAVGALISGFFSYFITETNYKKQLRLAALERRLDTHQKAYSLWWDIRSNIKNENKLDSILKNSIDWWKKNCLFLAPKSRAAFYNCINSAHLYVALTKAQTSKSEGSKEIRKIWDTIMLPGMTLVEEVNLPSFGEEEYIKSKLEKKK